MLRSDLIETCRFVTLIKTFAKAEARSVGLSFTTLSPGGKMSPALGGLHWCRSPLLSVSLVFCDRVSTPPTVLPLVYVYGSITWDGMNNCGYGKMLRPDTLLLQDYKKRNRHAMPTQVQICVLC
jgi:hypothetical protein